MKTPPTTVGTCIICKETELKVTLIDKDCPVCDECLQHFDQCVSRTPSECLGR